MKNQKLDDFLREKLEGRIMPTSDVWSRIEQSLDADLAVHQVEKQKRGLKSYLGQIVGVGIAASVAVGVVLFALHSQYDTSVDYAHHDDISAPHNSRHQMAHPGEAIKVMAHKDDLYVNNTIIQNNNAAICRYIQNYTQAQQGSNYLNDSYIDDEKYLTSTAPSNQNFQYQPVQKVVLKDMNAPQVGMQFEEEKPEVFVTHVPSLETTLQNNNIDIKESDKSYLTPTSSTKKKSLMTVGGGYSFGTLDQGYNVMLSSARDLNSKWFVEGNMGIVYNSAGSNQSSYSGNYLMMKKQLIASSQSNKMNIRFNNPDNHLFVQLNPIFGYKLTPSINLGIGPDYQQMVTNQGQDIIYFPAMASGKLLPRADFGIMGKAELKMSPRMKAGFLIREGMTSFIRNDIHIQNRSYIQLQLNYVLNKK